MNKICHPINPRSQDPFFVRWFEQVSLWKRKNKTFCQFFLAVKHSRGRNHLEKQKPVASFRLQRKRDDG